MREHWYFTSSNGDGLLQQYVNHIEKEHEKKRNKSRANFMDRKLKLEL